MSRKSKPRPIPYHAALTTPLLSFGGEEWCIRDAAEATAIWGAPGSGKTSGSGRTLAKAFLAAGMGGLVLCAKPEEADTWRKYAAEARRSDDLIVIDAAGSQRFNILDYAAKHLGGRGFEHNLVDLMRRLIEATQVAEGKAKGGDNEYFTQNAMKWVAHAFPLLLLTQDTLRLSDFSRFLASAPRTLDDFQSPQWRAGFCSQVHLKAGDMVHNAKTPEDQAYARRIVDEYGEFFLDEFPRLDNRPRSSIESTLTGMIFPFLSGKLAELFCTETTVTPEVCREGKIIVMDIPVLKYGATGAVAQTLFKYLFGLVAQQTQITEKTRPVFLYADEAQFFLNSADDDLLSTARQYKVCTVYLTQDLPTYYARLGSDARDKAEAILSKFGTRIFHANTSRETNFVASDLIGKVQKFNVGQTQSQTLNSGSGGNRGDFAGGYNGHDGASINRGESINSYMDHEIPPDYFAHKLRTGTKANGFMVDGIVIRNGRNWKRTKRHWIKAEFSQNA